MHLLLIEDDQGIIIPLRMYLEQSGYSVTVCTDGREAMECFKKEQPGLIILDINLPGKNGVEICREIREVGRTPIIILSARESEDDKVTLLELGADDYVSKPFSSRELVARIAAVAKRAEEKKENGKKEKLLTFGEVALDTKNFFATIQGNELKMTKTEFAILEYLIKNAKGVIKRDSLMKNIIGYENYIYDRTIDTHIKNIRKKLDGKINIETIRGIGYRIHEITE